MKTGNLKWWQTALISLAASGISALLTKKSGKEERRFYDQQLRQAPWAPPGWVFGPVWTVNNYFLVKALNEILALPESPEKSKLLRDQAGIWLIFFSFGYIYFTKKSTILSAVWTIADAALAADSYASARKVDKNLAANYLPLLSWTSFASTVAAYQAALNKDEFLKTPALMVSVN